jgi:hypothetical protein
MVFRTIKKFVFSAMIGCLLHTIVASELPIDDLLMPPITPISDKDRIHIQEKIPDLQKLIDAIIIQTEVIEPITEQYIKDRLERLKIIQGELSRVDEHQNPVILNSVEGPIKVMYWFVQCLYLHDQLKRRSLE